MLLLSTPLSSRTTAAQRSFIATTSCVRKELLTYATISCDQFVLLAVYLPGSQPVSATFYDYISAVFVWLASYSCPVVIFSVHVDDRAMASLNSCEKQPLVSDSSVYVALCWRGSGRTCLSIVRRLHYLLIFARVSAGSAAVHCVHSEPCTYGEDVSL